MKVHVGEIYKILSNVNYSDFYAWFIETIP
jgi:hypothetical protein